MNKDDFLDAVAPMNTAAQAQQCGSVPAWANPNWPVQGLGQRQICPGDMVFTAAGVSRSASENRWFHVDQCVGMYDNCSRRIAAYQELEIDVPEHLLEELEVLARKAKAAHREAQEAERQALREEIKALQSKEQKRKDAEAKLAALEEKLK